MGFLGDCRGLMSGWAAELALGNDGELWLGFFCFCLHFLHCSKYCSVMQETEAGSGNRVKLARFFISY